MMPAEATIKSNPFSSPVHIVKQTSWDKQLVLSCLFPCYSHQEAGWKAATWLEPFVQWPLLLRPEIHMKTIILLRRGSGPSVRPEPLDLSQGPHSPTAKPTTESGVHQDSSCELVRGAHWEKPGKQGTAERHQGEHRKGESPAEGVGLGRTTEGSYVQIGEKHRLLLRKVPGLRLILKIFPLAYSRLWSEKILPFLLFKYLFGYTKS